MAGTKMQSPAGCAETGRCPKVDVAGRVVPVEGVCTEVINLGRSVASFFTARRRKWLHLSRTMGGCE